MLLVQMAMATGNPGLVDFSMAFNRIDHNIIVTIHADLNVPTCALCPIITYLSDSKMCSLFNGAV